jgi:pimeloyl-ACP methyl ester carboxylesterase
MIRKLVLIDPAGVKAITLSRLLEAAQGLGFGEAILGLFGRGGLAKSIELDFYDPARDQAFVEKYMVQLKYKGVIRALLSTIRNGMLGDFMETYCKVGELGTPTLLFWGRHDKTVPLAHSVDLLKAIPQAEFHAFERCGHIPHYEKPEEANPILLEFLQ